MKKWFLGLFLIFSVCIFAEENAEVIVCDNGLEMLDWDLAFLEEATQSVEISGSYMGGTVLHRILEVLERRFEVAPDLQVYILSSPMLMAASDKDRIADFKRRFPHRFHHTYSDVVVDLFASGGVMDNHLKMVVVDGTYFSMGGTNLDEYLCTDGSKPIVRDFTPEIDGMKLASGARDQDLVIRSPLLAAQLREEFYKHYALWETYIQTRSFEKNPDAFAGKIAFKAIDEERLPQTACFDSSERKISVPEKAFKLIISGPHQNRNPISEEYVRLINGAKNEVVVANLYFNPNEKIVDSLVDASNRQLALRLFTNGFNKFSPPSNFVFIWAARMNYVPLFFGRTFGMFDFIAASHAPQNNVRVFEYAVKDIVYHKKVMVVDRKTSVIGSYNLGIRSDLHDYEMIFVIDSEEVAAGLLKVLEKDQSNSLEVSAKKARSWYFDPLKKYYAGIQSRFEGFM